MSDNWSEMFPDGRTIFYEGNNPKAFVKEIKAKFAFDPSKDNDCWNKRDGYSFLCPAHCLDEIYGNSKYPMGS